MDDAGGEPHHRPHVGRPGEVLARREPVQQPADADERPAADGLGEQEERAAVGEVDGDAVGIDLGQHPVEAADLLLGEARVGAVGRGEVGPQAGDFHAGSAQQRQHVAGLLRCDPDPVHARVHLHVDAQRGPQRRDGLGHGPRGDGAFEVVLGVGREVVGQRRGEDEDGLRHAEGPEPRPLRHVRHGKAADALLPQYRYDVLDAVAVRVRLYDADDVGLAGLLPQEPDVVTQRVEVDLGADRDGRLGTRTERGRRGCRRRLGHGGAGRGWVRARLKRRICPRCPAGSRRGCPLSPAPPRSATGCALTPLVRHLGARPAAPAPPPTARLGRRPGPGGGPPPAARRSGRVAGRGG